MKRIISMIIVTIIVYIGIVQSFADSTEQTFINGDLGDNMEAVLDTADSGYVLEDDADLPSSFDLSTSNSFPCVNSQGHIGSCAAWATTYYQFGYQVAAMNNWDAKNDPTKQFSPKFTYNIVNGGFDNGSYKDDIYEVLKATGAVRFSEFTPLSSDGDTEYLEWCTNTNALKNALKYRISSYKKYIFATGDTPITSYNDGDLDIMKQRLTDGYVLAFSTDFDMWDYQEISSVDSSHIGEDVCIKQYDPPNDSTDNDGHAMCIVGYDDNIQYDLNNDGVIQDFEKGAFKVVNSHGTSWGNDGFVWVMYDALNRVSNCDEQNVESRNAIFSGYSYFVIEVASYPCTLIAEVEITASTRKNLVCTLGYSSLSSSYLQIPHYTFVNYNGGKYNFSGTGETIQTATFAFDYSSFISHPAHWQKYYVGARNTIGAAVIESIKIIDSSGKVVVNDSEAKTIRSTFMEFGYPLGMVGDVDNSGSITTFDVTEIQEHLAQKTTLSDEALKVADVNGDGYVNTFDTTSIQLVLAQVDDGFENGIYECLV